MMGNFGFDSGLVEVRGCGGVGEEVLSQKGSGLERLSIGKILGWKGSLLRKYGRLY